MMSAPEHDKSLYERLGGESTVTQLVDAFYDRVLQDPELKPFFQNTSMEALRRMQREFFAAALGGPIKYAGRSLREAHRGRGIDKRAFGRFVEHMLQTLKAYNISEREIQEIIGRLNTYADDVTGDVSVDG